MTEYVVGFLFSGFEYVWLICKNKPDWQKGKINGIGGKIEEGETPEQAMRREFKEEAYADISSWKQFAVLSDDQNFRVYCFYAFSDLQVKSMTDEKVIFCEVSELPYDVLPNLRWLVPMALSFSRGETARYFYIKHEY